METPDISAFAEANPDLFVIGVAVRDTLPQAKRFADQFRPFHPLGFANEEFAAAYPNYFLPATFLIGPDGVVEQIRLGIVSTATLEELAGG